MAGYSKYYKQQKQVSYDSGNTWENLNEYQKGELIENYSTDCGYIGQLERWINSGYTCDGYNKYNVEVKQVSDDGVTWVSTGDSRRGSLAEVNSADCGYTPSPSSGYAGQYFTLVAVDDCNFHFGTSVDCYYSLDSGNTWINKSSYNTKVAVTAGNKVMIKDLIYPSDVYNSSILSVGSEIGERFMAEGNVMSLLYGDNFEDKTSLASFRSDSPGRGVFAGLLGHSYIVSAENLILPATTLSNTCYLGMFQDCYYLTKAPKLPASVLTNSCYTVMFENCTSLTTAPELPATTLAPNCYTQMFKGCSGLTAAPVLPARELAVRCYSDMFEWCSSLNYIKAMFTTTPGLNYTQEWVFGVSPTGTFVKNSAATWDVRGSSGIPDNWTVQTASS